MGDESFARQLSAFRNLAAVIPVMNLIYRKHAIMRMFERGISEQDIREILSTGEAIARYPDDKPYPSQLLLGWIDNKPMHVLTAETDNDETIIVTAYHPELALWEDNFKRRRP